MATYYRWQKSTVQYYDKVIEQFSEGEELPDYANYYCEGQKSGTQYIFESSNIRNLTTGQPISIAGGEYFQFYTQRFSGQDISTTSYTAGGNYINVERNSSGKIVVMSGSPENVKLQHMGFQAGPGTSQGYVYSTSSSAYPNGGVSGSYYYDQRTTVTSPTAPTGLTYPNPITTPTVTVSWDAATSNVPDISIESYQVAYAINGNPSLSVVGNTEASVHSINATIPKNANTIQFKVIANDANNENSGWLSGPWVSVYLAPNLTVPQMVMQGQSATVSWTAIDGADSYTLQRKANTDADWTQVYSGANLSYSETVGTWTSVQYPVQAVFSGTPGGWAESAAIPVVSSSALVISGTDGDLGTVVNDIPYSISTDTGNQITATITVNSAVIFSGNVGNSTSDTIPVLDLVNGEGTIVIEASVTASSGPVSAVRTWTYTKAPITFPNAGSVAQLTKEGENIFPKTLAGCVRLPGGKTLDEVTAFPCQVYAGSYVGTGTSGQNNPTTLTFPFEPKIVFIARGPTPTVGSLGTITPMIRGVQQSIVGINGSSRSIAYLTWDNNSLSFYGNGGADTSLNESGITYHYVAIG